MYTVDIGAVHIQLESMRLYLDQCYPKTNWRQHFTQSVTLRLSPPTSNHSSSTGGRASHLRKTQHADGKDHAHIGANNIPDPESLNDMEPPRENEVDRGASNMLPSSDDNDEEIS
jgi:hypothetical protein